jgi:hypothetical protein
MYLKFSMDPYPNSVHEDHLKHKAPKINVQNSTGAAHARLSHQRGVYRSR